MHKEDQAVGYKRPPKQTQFAKGKSGNPNGRPKSRQTVSAIFQKVGLERISVTEGGRVLKMAREEALIRRLWQVGLAGNPRVALDLLKVLSSLRDINSSSGDPLENEEMQTKIMNNFLKRHSNAEKKKDSQPQSGRNQNPKSEPDAEPKIERPLNVFY